MLRLVRFRNFKSLRDVSIDLARLTVFVGANGSGKSSVLAAIRYAVRAAVGGSDRVFGHERPTDWMETHAGAGETGTRADERVPCSELGEILQMDDERELPHICDEPIIRRYHLTGRKGTRTE